MAYEFKLPDLGEGLTEGEVARWLVREGQEIAEDDPLVEVQTDKATVEIPSPASGKVARILVGEGEVVAVGTVLVVIGEDGGADGKPAPEVKKLGLAEAPPTPARPKGAPVRATPLVRRIAADLGVDLAGVGGTGPQGRVTEEDVRNAASGTPAASSAPSTEGRRIPLRGTRRVIAEHMTRAHR